MISQQKRVASLEVERPLFEYVQKELPLWSRILSRNRQKWGETGGPLSVSGTWPTWPIFITPSTDDVLYCYRVGRMSAKLFVYFYVDISNLCDDRFLVESTACRTVSFCPCCEYSDKNVYFL